MKNYEYWTERARQRAENIDKNSAGVQKAIAKAYNETLVDISKDIENYILKYGEVIGSIDNIDEDTRNVYQALIKQQLDPIDMQAYRNKMDALMALYEAETDVIIQAEYMAKMKYLRARQQITVWEAMENMIEAELISNGMEIEIQLEKHLSDKYIEEYLQSHYESAVIAHLAMGVTIPNTQAVKEIINTPFNGIRLSDTVWNHSQTMRNDLAKTVRQVCIQGKNPKAVAGQLRKYLSEKCPVTARYATERIVITESGKVFNGARRESMIERGETHYKILAERSSKTCEKCVELDGVVVPIEEDILPVHPNCKCAYIPESAPDIRYNKEEVEYHYKGKVYDNLEDLYEQMEKDKTIHNKSLASKKFKREVISPSMSFKEWKEKYVTGNGD